VTGKLQPSYAITQSHETPRSKSDCSCRWSDMPRKDRVPSTSSMLVGRSRMRSSEGQRHRCCGGCRPGLPMSLPCRIDSFMPRLKALSFQDPSIRALYGVSAKLAHFRSASGSTAEPGAAFRYSRRRKVDFNRILRLRHAHVDRTDEKSQIGAV
jgi:hypothetical protein